MPIRHNYSTKFKLKITHKSDGIIGIGIIDSKQKYARHSWNSVNAMCYSSNGYKYPGGVKEGDGFKKGDVVELEVDRSANTIKYFVNNSHIATQTNKILGDNCRVFMPYVDLYAINDAVEWLL